MTTLEISEKEFLELLYKITRTESSWKPEYNKTILFGDPVLKYKNWVFEIRGREPLRGCKLSKIGNDTEVKAFVRIKHLEYFIATVKKYGKERAAMRLDDVYKEWGIIR